MSDPKAQVVYGPKETIEILLREEGGGLRSIPVDASGAPFAKEALASPEVLTALNEWAFSNDLPDAVNWRYMHGLLVRCDVDIEALTTHYPPRI